MQKRKLEPNAWIKFTSAGYVSSKGFGYENVSKSNTHQVQVVSRRNIGWIRNILGNVGMMRCVSNLFHILFGRDPDPCSSNQEGTSPPRTMW